MGMTTDFVVTPRPIYHADGAKSPDCYTHPPELHDRLTGPLGEFPLFTYWGPTAGITSSRWIAAAARMLLDAEDLDLLMVYLPHLDYDHQRFGPGAPESAAAARELDAVAGDLVDHARGRGDTVVVLSEYGITDARRPVDVNRALRRAGLLDVYTQAGMEYLDPWTSRAFAVADHQIAHVYVRDPADLPAARGALAGLPGIDLVLEGDARRDAGLGHARAGDLVLVAEPRRVVHLLLLARRRAGARLRQAGRDPPQAGLRPGGAVHGSRRTGWSRRAPAWRSRARSSACAT